VSYLLRLLGKGLAGDFTGYLSKFLRPPDDVTLESVQHEATAHPARAEAQLMLGLKQMELGRFAPARQALDAAVRLNPNLEDARVALAAVLSDLGSPADAVGVLQLPTGATSRPPCDMSSGNCMSVRATRRKPPPRIGRRWRQTQGTLPPANGWRRWSCWAATSTLRPTIMRR